MENDELLKWDIHEGMDQYRVLLKEINKVEWDCFYIREDDSLSKSLVIPQWLSYKGNLAVGSRWADKDGDVMAISSAEIQDERLILYFEFLRLGYKSAYRINKREHMTDFLEAYTPLASTQLPPPIPSQLNNLEDEGCRHLNKYTNHAGGSTFVVCPDCKQEIL